MNGWNERVKDSENFSAIITKIGVAAAKIWWKEFCGLICNFWKVARGISGIFFKNQGSSWKFVDCELIMEKGKGLNEKVAGIFSFQIIF
jgi:hypothetical protein